MIPLSLVTGFLGSGKTTFLKRCVERYRSRKVVYLVNEFSARDVDGALLRSRTDDVVSLAGGSIFCRCLVTEFIAALKEIPDRFGSPGSPVEGVVIEASGMANPRVAAVMLAEARLDSTFALSTVVSVVDPGSFLKLLHTLPAVRSQIEASNVALLNKTDAYPAPVVEAAAEALQSLRPDLRVLRTRFCEADVDLFGPPLPAQPGGEYAPCRDPAFETFVARPQGSLDLAALRSAVEPLRDEVYRIKGFATLDGRRRYLDFSGSGFRCEDAPGDGEAELVFILRGPSSRAAQELVRAVETGGFRGGTPPPEG